MTEEHEPGVVIEEVAAPAAQDEPAPEKEETVDNGQDRNWREVRQAMSQMAMQNEEMRQELERLRKPPEPESPPVELPDDEWVTGREAKSFAADYVKKAVQDQLKAALAQQDESTAEDRLKSKFSDYDKIVTDSAVNKLKEEDPDFVEAIRTSKASTYQKGAAVYNYLRRLVPSQTLVEENQKRAEANSKKPRPLDAVGRSSPLAAIDANGGSLTPELKRSLYEDMKRAAANG